MTSHPTAPARSARDVPRWKVQVFALLSVAVSLAAVAALLLVLELGVRWSRGALSVTGGVAADGASVPPRPLTRTAIAVPDPLLGHIPAPNLKGFKNFEASISTDAESIRLNGPASRPSGDPILALGDSFTFGLEVDDDASWPAGLERVLQRPVINAGVFGYGLDQIVLRGEQLVETRPVDRAVLAVFAGDIERCEFSYLFAPKPYFAIRDGSLELRNVPVPPAVTPVRLASVRSALRHSQLADALFSRLAPQWWMVQGRERREHDQGDEVASLLLDRWSQFARQRNIQTLYVALVGWPRNVARLRALTRHAVQAGLDVLDLSEPLSALIQADKNRWQAAAGHLTREGNEWVAAQIAGRLASRQSERTR